MVIELTADDQSRLTEMAASTQQSETELAREAMHWFLSACDSEASHSRIVARSRQQILDGRTIDHEALFSAVDDLLKA